MASIFRLKGVFPYTLTIFLNAFVDLGHKIVIQNTLFKTLDGNEQIFLTGILNALILLPLALLFSPSGFISDRFSKPKVMRYAAAFAVLLTSAITLCYYLGQFEAAFVMTFLLAIQSALYSPAKYGYLRELAGKQRLTEANALVQSTTIVAILSGTFCFSILFEYWIPNTTTLSANSILKAVAPIGWLLVLSSVIELIGTFRLPHRDAAAADIQFKAKQYFQGKYLSRNVRAVYRDPVIWLSIIGLSVFWGISQVMVIVFPAFAKETLGETNTVIIQGLIACTGIGLIIGATIAGKISKNYIETGLIPIGAVGISLGLFLLPGLQTATAMATTFLFIGICSGLFVVPLNALIQFHAEKSALSRVLAANNLFQTLSMLGFITIIICASVFDISSQILLLLIGVVSLLGAIYTIYRLPHSLIRIVLARTIGMGYKVKVSGLQNLPSKGGVLLLGNHVSFIDWAIIGISSPRKVRFVMHKKYYNKWYLRKFLHLLGCIPIAPGESKVALKTVNRALNNGEVVCLFPEGALTKDGKVKEFKKGFEHAAKNANGVIVPFYLDGLWGTKFSLCNRDKITQPSDKVHTTFGEAIPLSSDTVSVRDSVLSLAPRQNHHES